MDACHQVWLRTVGEFTHAVLGFDPREVSVRDWLRTRRSCCAAHGGRSVRRRHGDLTHVRDQLSWYPDDVWRYVLACQWNRLAQEEAFVGRSGQVGDELGLREWSRPGSVRDLMRLAFLIEREYAPYSKWLGTAFADLSCVPVLGPSLTCRSRATRVARTGTPPRDRVRDGRDPFQRLGTRGTPRPDGPALLRTPVPRARLQSLRERVPGVDDRCAPWVGSVRSISSSTAPTCSSTHRASSRNRRVRDLAYVDAVERGAPRREVELRIALGGERERARRPRSGGRAAGNRRGRARAVSTLRRTRPNAATSRRDCIAWKPIQSWPAIL